MPSCVIAHSREEGELYNIETLPEFFINSCMHIRQTDFKLLLVHLSLTRVRDETFFYRSIDIFPSLIWQRIDIVWLIKCACAHLRMEMNSNIYRIPSGCETKCIWQI